MGSWKEKYVESKEKKRKRESEKWYRSGISRMKKKKRERQMKPNFYKHRKDSIIERTYGSLFVSVDWRVIVVWNMYSTCCTHLHVLLCRYKCFTVMRRTLIDECSRV